MVLSLSCATLRSSRDRCDTIHVSTDGTYSVRVGQHFLGRADGADDAITVAIPLSILSNSVANLAIGRERYAFMTSARSFSRILCHSGTLQSAEDMSLARFA